MHSLNFNNYYIESDSDINFSVVLEKIGERQKQLSRDIALINDYQYNKNVAIGTGVPAIAALVAIVAICILFPPTILALAGLALAGASFLALTITSSVYIDRARKGYELKMNPMLQNDHFKIKL